ncbi:MAG: desulfoferrodoxin [Nitrospiraceae bacterium]|nr:MAG: desulfoferrodoxin [Nitrospiraceae bacterium]
MTELNQIFKCDICGNIVEMVHSGKGQLVCCGKPMELQKANNQDASVEKHVPVVDVSGEGIKVTVGSARHPMEDKHYIEWIEIVSDDRLDRKYLKPGEPPVAEFCSNEDSFGVRAYCNIHGLWKDR